jgi:hypothetical protein
MSESDTAAIVVDGGGVLSTPPLNNDAVLAFIGGLKKRKHANQISITKKNQKISPAPVLVTNKNNDSDDETISAVVPPKEKRNKTKKTKDSSPVWLMHMKQQ